MDVPGFTEAFGLGYTNAVIFWAHDLLPPAEQALIEALPWDLVWLRAVESPAYPASAAIPPGTVVPGTEGWYFHTLLAASPFLALTHDTVLRALGQVDLGLAGERRHLDAAAERGRRHRHRHRAMQIVAVALEDLVRLDAQLDVQVARRPAVGSRLAIAGRADAIHKHI